MVCVSRGTGHTTRIVNAYETVAAWLEQRPLPGDRSVENFQAAVRDQLIKDFQWDVDRVRSANVDLIQLLKDEIEWGMERDATGLFASFYRLDLGEAVIRSVLESHERPEACVRLAEKSLERAAMKVWMRWTFGAATSSMGTSR